jgi:hypothetical protein
MREMRTVRSRKEVLQWLGQIELSANSKGELAVFMHEDCVTDFLLYLVAKSIMCYLSLTMHGINGDTHMDVLAALLTPWQIH